LFYSSLFFFSLEKKKNQNEDEKTGGKIGITRKSVFSQVTFFGG
jgi:hypothetical protein